MEQSYEKRLLEYRGLIENELMLALHSGEKLTVDEAMRYSTLGGGKRVRGVLALEFCRIFGGEKKLKKSLPTAAAIEMIHAFSLIHDDLPCMDNDELRRGKPTCHVVYGQALAILAGDALLSYAMEVMGRICAESRYLKARLVAAMLVIIQAAGANGMVAGQVQDITWEHKKADADALLYIQEHKTMALIAACAEAGGIIGGASPAMVGRLKYIGQCIGRAFQIKDDILDLTATADELGKSVGSDEKNQKNTYVSVFGIDKAQEDYTQISDEARKTIASLSFKSTTLQALADEIIKRKK
jgi:geranylgeranyl diphosphate synthase type II